MMSDPGSVVRVAAVGDLHCSKNSAGLIQPLFEDAAKFADVLVLCGDLTDYGLPEEAQVLVDELPAPSKLPIVAVLGNHDFESGRRTRSGRSSSTPASSCSTATPSRSRGSASPGRKGFAGGFGRGTLGAWGEPAIKEFVQEAIDEALKLESALARLRTEQRIAVLHYAPIRATVEGEPVEIFPFLGCSRLEEPLNRYPVTAVFHGHAHNGSPRDAPATGVPVYNVSLPLRRTSPTDRHCSCLGSRAFDRAGEVVKPPRVALFGRAMRMSVSPVRPPFPRCDLTECPGDSEATHLVSDRR